MISNRKLNMVFTRGNATKTISLANPRQDVTGAEVHSVMKDIVAKEVFSYDDEDGKHAFFHVGKKLRQTLRMKFHTFSLLIS